MGVRGGECACAACTCVCACLGVRLGCACVDVRVFVVCLHCACAVNAFVCVLRTFRALVPVLLRAHTCVSVSVSLCVCVHELCARICVCAPSNSNNRPPAPRSRFPANNRTRRRLWDQHPPMFCSSGSASRPRLCLMSGVTRGPLPDYSEPFPVPPEGCFPVQDEALAQRFLPLPGTKFLLPRPVPWSWGAAGQ